LLLLDLIGNTVALRAPPGRALSWGRNDGCSVAAPLGQAGPTHCEKTPSEGFTVMRPVGCHGLTYVRYDLPRLAAISNRRPPVALGKVDGLDSPNTQDTVAEPKASIAERLREIRAAFLVGLGLLVTVSWIAILGWLLYRSILTLGFIR